MTSNSHQLSTKETNFVTLLNSVGFFPSIIDLGTADIGGWIPKPYANLKREVLQISMDDIQNQKSTLMDNVFNVIGISSFDEQIRILPSIYEMVESAYADQNFSAVIPMAITELNMIFEMTNYKLLKARGKAGTAIAWSCGPKFINDIDSLIALKTPRTMDKILIINPKTETHIKGIISPDQSQSWLDRFKSNLSESRTTLRVCECAGDEIILITRPLLAEYTGQIPTIEDRGFDARKKEYWNHFLMSNSEFRVRPGATDGVQVCAITGMDATKIGEKVCPK